MSTQPGWREPMLATLTERRFSDANWLYERKLDGVRAIAARDDGEPVLWSRNHKSMNASYPEVVDALADQGGPRFVVDGEIVAFDGNQTSFAKLQPRIHLTDRDRARATGIEIFYYVFDLLHYDGHEAVTLPLRQRKKLLRDCFTFVNPLRMPEHRNADGEGYYRQACARGWEGLIAKRVNSLYLGGRSRDWLKFKCVQDQEFVVGGFTEPQGSRNGFGALLLGYHEDGALRYAGKVGTGYDEATLRTLRAELDTLTRAESPFDERVGERHVHWVEPEMVVQIGFTEWTEDARLRHPRYTGVRRDKNASDVVRERR